jgi:hypothetical protein
MTSEAARTKIEALSIPLSDESFFKYLKAGDREVVELFLDAGFSPDLLDAKRTAAVVVATEAGQKDLARLLLARGASQEPLLTRPAQQKDGWDKLTASSAVLGFISGLLIAAVGGYFTYSYNQRQIDLNRTQMDHDAATKEQANRVLELEAVQKLIPILTSKDEQAKAAALISIQDLAHPELAAHFAVLFKGQGSVQYLKQAASSANPSAKRTAFQALSTIATSGTEPDSKLAISVLDAEARKLLSDYAARLHDLDRLVKEADKSTDTETKGADSILVYRIAYGAAEYRTSLPEFQNLPWATLIRELEAAGVPDSITDAINATDTLMNGPYAGQDTHKRGYFGPGILDAQLKTLQAYYNVAQKHFYKQ